MNWQQRENAERNRRIAAARKWAEDAGKDGRNGFPEWYGDTGHEDPYEAAYAAWTVSPARIERWAERNGIYIGRGFARWYLAAGRTDFFADAYEVYRAAVLGREPRTGVV